MSKLIIERECGCFRNSQHSNNEEFNSKDEALISGKSMLDDMNNNFCGKHQFVLKEEGDDLMISMKQEESSGGCCGGGHCS